MTTSAQNLKNLNNLVGLIFGGTFLLILVFVYRLYGIAPSQLLPFYALLSAVMAIFSVYRWEFGTKALLFFMPFVGSATFFFALNGGLGSLLKDMTFYIPALLGFSFVALTQVKARVRLRSLLFGQLRPAIAAFGLFCAVLAAIFIQSNSRYTAFILAGALGIKLLLGYMPLILMGYFLFKDFNDFQVFIRRLAVFSFFVSGFVILQFFLTKLGLLSALNDLAKGSSGDLYGNTLLSEGGLYRFSGTFSAPSQLAGYLTFHLMLLTTLLINDDQKYRLQWLLGLTITLGAIIFSGQKALLFLSPILIIIVCIIYKSYATLLQLLSAAACILLIAFVAAPDNIGAQFNWAFERFSNGTDTVSLNAAQLSSSASSSTALIGNGLGLGSAQTRFLLPKGYFIFIETYQAKLIYEIGFFGTFFYYAMLLSLAVLLFIAIRNAQPQMRPYMIFCLLNFSYCSLMPFNYFDFDPTNIYIWLFMGIGLSLGAMPALDRGSPVTANRLGSQ